MENEVKSKGHGNQLNRDQLTNSREVVPNSNISTRRNDMTTKKQEETPTTQNSSENNGLQLNRDQLNEDQLNRVTDLLWRELEPEFLQSIELESIVFHEGWDHDSQLCEVYFDSPLLLPNRIEDTLSGTLLLRTLRTDCRIWSDLMDSVESGMGWVRVKSELSSRIREELVTLCDVYWDRVEMILKDWSYHFRTNNDDLFDEDGIPLEDLTSTTQKWVKDIFEDEYPVLSYDREEVTHV